VGVVVMEGEEEEVEAVKEEEEEQREIEPAGLFWVLRLG
jgi:hypothetical protein